MTVGEPTIEVGGTAPEPVDGSAILTIPNVISLVRLLCLPIFVYLMFGRDNRAAAAGLLAVLGATDWIDGYIARHYHQVSDLGKILDPVADRLLFFVGIGCILIDGSVPVWFAWMVLVREFVVAATTVVLGLMGARRVDVTWFGKAGTFGLMFAFPLFLASESTMGWADTGRVFAWVTGIPGLAFSYVAWALYLPLGIKALREGRADRAAAEAA
ncbi:CDP-alcohol phosphatidyltransferase family protein [Aquihabitans sp. G128]|uniref:CDP-alcohol phosphatidyltransferase family protein n=1 Tax=Aquihabitans sp. G128 TaxID=2849779 RepID=UPI0020B20AC6|nr:CDP-alcohol phosphatidyltransferase family protein [Aquihabitans sp. G128]